MTTNLSSETLLAYAERYGIKGRRTLSILGKNQQFINAMNSPVGIEFLRYLIEKVDTNRVAFQKADIDLSDRKFIEIRARLNESEDLLYGFLTLLDNHEKMLNQIKEDLGKH